MTRAYTTSDKGQTVPMDNIDYGILDILKKEQDKRNKQCGKGPLAKQFALKLVTSNTRDLITKQLNKRNINIPSSSSVTASINKLINLGLITTQITYKNGDTPFSRNNNTYEVTDKGLEVLEERPERVALINNGGERDYHGPNIR